jgi:hypothetical protein
MTFALGKPDGTGQAPFRFSAAGPSPFTMTDEGRPAPTTIAVRGGYWAGTGDNAVKLGFSTDDITPGGASGKVHAAAGSPLAKLMGGTDAAYLPQYSYIAAEHWGHGSYRKQLFSPAAESHRFGGSCSLRGTDTFTPPVDNDERDLHLVYDATGTCSGTLDGRAADAVPVHWMSTAHSNGWCSGAKTLEPGSARISFPDGTTIAATLDFTSVFTEVDMSLYGERSGFAGARATFATSRTSPQVFSDCAGGGARTVPMDLSFSTRSDLISLPPQPLPRALRLSGRPRTLRAGRSARLTFCAATDAGQRLAGVRVHFAGHRARTGTDGCATITATLRRPGRRTAVARKAGYLRARTAIRVLA